MYNLILFLLIVLSVRRNLAFKNNFRKFSIKSKLNAKIKTTFTLSENNINFKEKMEGDDEWSNYIMSKAYFEKNNIDLDLVVYGEPIPLMRHRVARGHMYNPVKNLQTQFAEACLEYLPINPLEGALEVQLIFYFKRPKSHYRTGKYSSELKASAPVHHTGTKDLDNLVKFVLDALNKKAYKDDGQICSIYTHKFYTNYDPRIVIKIKKIGV